MSKLNLDIISLILDFIYWKDDLSVDRPSLAVASQISRAWRQAAQARLFHSVIIEARWRMSAFTRSAPTRTRRGKQLRAIVRELTFVLSSHTTVMGIAPPHSLLEKDLISVLSGLPNLYQLRIYSFAAKVTRGFQTSLAAPKMPKIRSIVVDYVAEPPDREHQIFFDFLSLPSVERVLFVGKGTYRWASHTRIAQRPQAALKELRLDLRHSQPSVRGIDLSWVISGSPNSLEILHLYDMVLDPTMTEFLTEVAPRLVSFHVSSSRHSDLAGLADWLQSMARLKELVIRNDMPSADCFRVATDLPRVMNVLPESVRHLGFAVESHSALRIARSELTKWNLRTGVCLSVLTLVLLTNGAFGPDWVDVPEVNRLRLFQFTDNDILFAFSSPMIPAVRFPRIVDSSILGIVINGQEEEIPEKASSRNPLKVLRHLIKGR
ncbi:hypothetical protein FRC17_009920 [Serendipita sp. 399]|nr:hypothetical protein FRC17_009920 [Serendipita sp. 399]